MLSILRSASTSRTLLQISRVGAYTRHFASEVSDSTPTTAAPSGPGVQEKHEELESLDDKPLRPPHGVTCDPKHGLRAFFREFETPDGRKELMSAEPKAEAGNSGVFFFQVF